MALFPFILVDEECALHDNTLLNHEKIHLRQQAELLVIPFYLLYLLNYLFNLTRYHQHEKAYLNISFEREAYTYEADHTYLYKRGWYSWIKFL